MDITGSIGEAIDSTNQLLVQPQIEEPNEESQSIRIQQLSTRPYYQDSPNYTETVVQPVFVPNGKK